VRVFKAKSLLTDAQGPAKHLFSASQVTLLLQNISEVVVRLDETRVFKAKRFFEDVQATTVHLFGARQITLVVQEDAMIVAR